MFKTKHEKNIFLNVMFGSIKYKENKIEKKSKRKE